MSVGSGNILMSVTASNDYAGLDEDDRQRVTLALRNLRRGVVREEDIDPYPFYRRPYVAHAQCLRTSSTLHILFVTRQDGDHVIVEFKHMHRYRVANRRVDVRANPAPAARRTTGIAVRIAGRRRHHLHSEWAAVLLGAPEDDLTFSPRRQLLLAHGFMLAAVRMRLHDLARPAWRPLDWLLRTSSRTNAFITATVGGQAIWIVGDGGLSALVTQVWEPCGIAGASLLALARWLRRVRGIELTSSEGERADE
ncbi:hypothetical protein [Streptomyces sp. G7(2002)]|uniref:hypothetical protein n=1 Tax=Streptomyces sp. G7(2002) TaxID=2971798 RepID=UPI00237ED2FB|nr:hypothetical protein [Streptomyces sp. G7(2002)]WDT55759.1 hypothetical protein NUT86_17765 [Streptomyces sp. G7(2002)]